jgi:hypothetical protein
MNRKPFKPLNDVSVPAFVPSHHLQCHQSRYRALRLQDDPSAILDGLLSLREGGSVLFGTLLENDRYVTTGIFIQYL